MRRDPFGLRPEIERFRKVLAGARPRIQDAIEQAREEACEAELAPMSWDLSGPKGAEMRLEMLEGLADMVESLDSLLEELSITLEML